jgi:uncharacterized repeat protein (TIGR01451 family)
LKFTNSGGSWNTSFYTVPVNVDTKAPVVASGPSLNPGPTNGSYQVGQQVTVSYRCTDELSGIVQCGSKKFSTPVNDTGLITLPVDTSKTGQFTISVTAVDAAGNCTTPVTVKYTVQATPPVSLTILKLAPLLVKQNAQMTYAIGVANLNKNTASSVTVTDTLPSGVTFVKASVLQAKNAASCTVSGNTVTCTTPSMTLLTPMAIEIVVKATAKAGSKISNTATVSSANPNTPPGNSRSTAITLVY